MGKKAQRGGRLSTATRRRRRVLCSFCFYFPFVRWRGGGTTERGGQWKIQTSTRNELSADRPFAKRLDNREGATEERRKRGREERGKRKKHRNMRSAVYTMGWTRPAIDHAISKRRTGTRGGAGRRAGEGAPSHGHGAPTFYCPCPSLLSLPATIATSAPTTAASTPPTTVPDGADTGALFG